MGSRAGGVVLRAGAPRVSRAFARSRRSGPQDRGPMSAARVMIAFLMRIARTFAGAR
ncbi:hypothetical protein A33M_1163 [Rhodovulum sp. PH10]|nr:hypothetical protein A33M_1163 [Rhodovulum sp. PH10]